MSEGSVGEAGVTPPGAVPFPVVGGEPPAPSPVTSLADSTVPTVPSASADFTAEVPAPATPTTSTAEVPVPGTAARPLVPRWCGILLILLGLCTVPWIAGLAVELPNRVQTAHYAFSWAGFDVLLASLLLWTGWGAVRNSEEIGVSAAVTSGLLVVDAWFDVTSASTAGQLVAALAMAAFVELPLAVFCLWLSGRAESARRRRTARMIAMVGRLWQYRSRALRRVRPVPERR
ncbi:MAG: hypothetical protein HOV83_22955 [Catenulispora sp.]|nr:hypothetical protein [Catenulispora sp.]